MLKTLLAQGLCQAIEGEYLLLIVALTRLDDSLRLLVGKATVGVYHRATKPLVEDVEVLVKGEDRREAQLILVRTQRA